MKTLLAGGLLVVGVLGGVVGAAVGMVLAGAVWPVLGVMTAGAVCGVAVGCGLPVWGARRVAGWPGWLPAVVCGVVAVGYGAAVLWPGERAVPGRADAYWELPTGSRLAYRLTPAQGPARPEPVLRLHGGPGTPGEAADGLDEALSRAGYQVYSYDQLGSGDSPRPADLSGYTVQRQVDDLEAIRERLGAPRMVLIGASWGGTLAAEYLAAHPEHVARVVFTSPGALWTPEYTDEQAGQLWDRLTPEQRARVDALGGNGLRVPLWSLLMGIDPAQAHALLPDDQADALMEQLLAVSGSAATCRPGAAAELPVKTPGAYANQLIAEDLRHRPDPRPALRAVHVPALVLRGECDYKHWEVTREYRDTLPGAQLLYVPGAGHAIAVDRPAEYRAAVLAFLTGTPLPGTPYTGTEDPAKP
ncbi:alpha/beta fold hydrolase [Kitasatospora cheerisanensis]|uniref:alpha/beta fold hydrolase n=1 Tax=Kitasatospora cheerisanensis TaxID=81942 RepID=UPI0009FEFE21|nr:alpha/beta fold hydrolase [Kitasatospora cheerisanensis]